MTPKKSQAGNQCVAAQARHDLRSGQPRKGRNQLGQKWPDMVRPAAHIVDQIDRVGIRIFRARHHELQARGVLELALCQRGRFSTRLDWDLQAGVRSQWFKIMDHVWSQLSKIWVEGMQKTFLALHRGFAIDIAIGFFCQKDAFIDNGKGCFTLCQGGKNPQELILPVGDSHLFATINTVICDIYLRRLMMAIRLVITAGK